MTATLDQAETTTLPEILSAMDAVGHPLRARILLELRHWKASPNELAGDRVSQEHADKLNLNAGPKAKRIKANPRGLGATLGTVAYHVRWLADRGLVKLVGETRVRGAVEHHYDITPAGRDKVQALAALDGGTITITP